MYGNTRRGRGGIGTVSSPGLCPTIGADIPSLSIADRVSNLNLTASTLTAEVEVRIRRLLEEILIRGQFAENAFELVAYACALESERDTRLLAMIFDQIFEMVKQRQDVIYYLGRLFLLFRSEILPTLQDGATTGADSIPLKGSALFMRYLSRWCRRELDFAWTQKENAKEHEGDIGVAVRHWNTLVDLANDLRKRYLLHESIVHDIIDRQLSTSCPTAEEVYMIITMLSPEESNASSFEAKDRMEAHYSELRKMVENEDIEHRLRQKMQDQVLKLLPEVTSDLILPSSHILQRDDRIHPLATNAPSSVPMLGLHDIPSTAPETKIQSKSSGMPTSVANNAGSTFEDGGFYVDAKTPITAVIAYFTRVAQPPIIDLSSGLESATFSEAPVSETIMSVVWRATLRNGMDVAVKCVKSTILGNEKTIKHTVRELSAWSQQEHINILRLLGIGFYKNRLAMVSEWMEQGNIVEVVNKHPDADRYHLCVQVTEAVAWLHNKDLIHGDLKGANILVSNDGLIKVTDFGLAVMRDGVLQLSETFEGGGTLRWMAPEMFGENVTKSFKTDVYALGMTMLEVLTGQEPFPEISTPHGIIKAVSIDRQIPKRPDHLAERTPRNDIFWDVMVKCWVYNPSRRMTAEEVRSLISRVENTAGLMKSVSAKHNSLCSDCTLA